MPGKDAKIKRAMEKFAKEFGTIEQGYKVYNSQRIFSTSTAKNPHLLTKKEILMAKILFWHDFCHVTFKQLAWECKRNERTIRRHYQLAKIFFHL